MPNVEMSRTDSFMLRVEQHMEGLPRSERVPFLKAQRTKFIADYERFSDDVDAGRPRPNENAFDYADTIAALGARLTQEERNHG